MSRLFTLNRHRRQDSKRNCSRTGSETLIDISLKNTQKNISGSFVTVNVRFEFFLSWISNHSLLDSCLQLWKQMFTTTRQITTGRDAKGTYQNFTLCFNGGKVRNLLIFAFVIISLKLFFSSLWHFWMSYFFNHTMFTLELIFYITIYSNGYRFWRIV